MRRPHRTAVAVAAGLCALSLGGCMQMTRHSNTLVFGTNTSFGVVVGTDATSTPSIAVGYKRQEAVVMPLVANVKSVTSGGESVLEPCLIGPAAGDPHGAAVAGSAETHPCLLVGRDKDQSLDAYSVLASFGTRYDAQSTGAGGSIAQYFATGVAAQTLARSGGAAVATGSAAVKSADPANVRLQTLMQDPGTTAAAAVEESARTTTLSDLADAVAAVPQDALATRLGQLDVRLGTRTRAPCAGGTPAACAELIRGGLGGLGARSSDQISAGVAIMRGQ